MPVNAALLLPLPGLNMHAGNLFIVWTTVFTAPSPDGLFPSIVADIICRYLPFCLLLTDYFITYWLTKASASLGPGWAASHCLASPRESSTWLVFSCSLCSRFQSPECHQDCYRTCKHRSIILTLVRRAFLVILPFACTRYLILSTIPLPVCRALWAAFSPLISISCRIISRRNILGKAAHSDIPKYFCDYQCDTYMKRMQWWWQ